MNDKRVRALLPIVLAIAGGILIFNLIAFAFGEAPASALRLAFEGTWGTPYGLGQVLFKATPLLFTGLAFEVALRAGLFNIGAEGQLALASLVGGLVASKLPASLPMPIALPIVLASAAAVGALVAFVPAILRARRGVHEIITAIMVNRIVDAILPWTFTTVLGSNSLRTADIAPGAALPRLDRIVPSFAGSAASFAFPLAVVSVFVGMALLERSRLGREIRWVGFRAEACRAEGIDVERRLLLAMLLSGAIAALAVSSTALGYKGYYELGLGAGAGWSGIAVAMLGRGKAVGIVLAAIFLGTLEQAGLAVNARVPKEAMDVLEATLIVLVAVASRVAAKGARAATNEGPEPEPPRDKPAPTPASEEARS
ncbi:ABC transporter permease [Polyangium sorediatum]|uniref:ABC transporter permease n=1 Tax=Polyangium sorediatum TaxID=889274 RepID=A0ABT6NNM5_9BACT|nr:ABC transporter permease [Polyangium sorediatum]MDI1429883.1 ABC transporter permease [Polyangium sorediatum]